MNNDDAQKQPEAPELTGEVGNQLRKAREAKGMSIAQVADTQHLRPSVIQAIEDGQYEKIGSELFLKGYVRTYAEQVGLNPAELMDKLDWELEPMRQQAEEEKRENPLETIERRKQRKRKIARWTLLSLLLVAIVGVGVRFMDSELLPFDLGEPSDTADAPSETSDVTSPDEPSGSAEPAPLIDDGAVNGSAGGNAASQESTAQQERTAPPESSISQESSIPQEQSVANEGAEDAPVTTEPEAPAESSPQNEPSTSRTGPAESAMSQEALVSTPVEETQDGATDSSAEQGTVSGTEPALTDNEAATPENASSAEEAPAAVAGEVLSASFTGDCWVSVKNGAGQTVIASLKRAGDNLRYEGQGPFRVVLGAADAATLSFNGEVVDLSRYPAPNNRVALTLGN